MINNKEAIHKRMEHVDCHFQRCYIKQNSIPKWKWFLEFILFPDMELVDEVVPLESTEGQEPAYFDRQK